MRFNRNIPVLAVAAAFGLAACSDEPATGAGAPRISSVPIAVEVSSTTAKAGDRVAVAIKLDAAENGTGGIQGELEFDATRLRYVGQSPVGEAVSLVNAKAATSGNLKFTSFNPNGIRGTVAMFVFEARGAGYAPSIRYVSKAAASSGGNVRRLTANVRNGVTVDASLSVPREASTLTVADWAARITPTAKTGGAIAARPGEYVQNLRYGNIDYSVNAQGAATIDLFDYLAVANAAVGNEPIINDTDSPTRDVDLVVAGNVFPTNSAGACGNEPDGSRALDLFDYLAIANVAVGNPETCAGNIIPGRGPLASNVVAITGGSTGDPASGVLPCPGGAVSWSKSNVYQLNGVVRVLDGCTLTIEAGTVVKGNTLQQPSSLYIYRGARIIAEGTPYEPIVFTCTAATKVAGCWGGLWISGRSTVNTGTAAVVGDPETGPSPDGNCNQRKAEAGNAPGFGGCNPADNSGVLSYVIIEYGGFIVSGNRELNNLTLAGVGSGTRIDHVQAHGGLDDAIEFFGGTVNTSYIVATGNNDDGQDTDFGATGLHQFWIISPDGGNSANNDDSRAFESDNAESSSEALPRTEPRNYNFTITGFNVTSSANSLAAIMIRRGSRLKLYNSIIDGYQRAITIRDAFSCGGTALSNDPVVENTTFMDVGSLGSASDSAQSPALCFPAAAATSGLGPQMEASFLSSSTGYRARNIASGVLGINQALFGARDNLVPDFRMRTPAETGVSTVPAGLVQTTYRGAVPPLSAGSIPWYAGWTRGWQSAGAP